MDFILIHDIKLQKAVYLLWSPFYWTHRMRKKEAMCLNQSTATWTKTPALPKRKPANTWGTWSTKLGSNWALTESMKTRHFRSRSSKPRRTSAEPLSSCTSTAMATAINTVKPRTVLCPCSSTLSTRLFKIWIDDSRSLVSGGMIIVF